MNPFSIFSSSGNRFIIIDDMDGKMNGERGDFSERAKMYCAESFGVGADGLILAVRSDIADLRMRIFNKDGTEAEMCGNGICCLAKFVQEEKIVDRWRLRIETLAGIRETSLIGRERVQVEMGKPEFYNQDADYEIPLDGSSFRFRHIRIGVPHTVIPVDNVSDVPLGNWGRRIEGMSIFPKGTNVNFMQPHDKESIMVRTWERGVGETNSCGTGCCASAVAARQCGMVKDGDVDVWTPGGSNKVQWEGEGHGVYMIGRAKKEY